MNIYVHNIERTVGKILAFVTWRINRFGEKDHNNKSLNKEYFTNNKDEIKRILHFLNDDESRSVFKNCIKYRSTHKVKDQPEYIKKEQYFPKDFINLQNEVFIDCGAYNGDTIKEFIKQSNGIYRKIVAFEPSLKNLDKIRYEKGMEVICAGVWPCNTTLAFSEEGEGSRIVNTDDVLKKTIKVNCRSIDSCIECLDATFIKMDVEGAELEALKGAKSIIQKNRPILAICIYHSPKDMLKIPLYIYDTCKNYKFYIRHHSHRCAETVFYAVPQER